MAYGVANAKNANALWAFNDRKIALQPTSRPLDLLTAKISRRDSRRVIRDV